MDVWAVVCAIAAGFCTAVEQNINGRLGREITPSLATLHNLTLGAVFFFLINLIKGSLEGYKKIVTVNPLLLTGGFFGAMIIYLSTKAVPALGVTVTLTLVIAGQLTCGIMTDIFVNKIAFGFSDWIGIVFVITGAIIMMR